MHGIGDNKQQTSRPGRNARSCPTHKLIWYTHIHSDIVDYAQACRHCAEKGKNLKPLIPKLQLEKLSPLSEPNEEV